MTRSTITTKNQTTVPKEVRERLRVGLSDVLVWEVEGNTVRVSIGSPQGGDRSTCPSVG